MQHHRPWPGGSSHSTWVARVGQLRPRSLCLKRGATPRLGAAALSSPAVQELERLQPQLELSISPTPARPTLEAACGSKPTASAPSPRAPCHKPDENGTAMTPAKLAALSAALRMPVRQLQALLPHAPALATAVPAHVAGVLQALQADLGCSPYEARRMVTHAADTVLTTPTCQLVEHAHRLASLLRLPPKSVLSASSSIPSILRRDPKHVAEHLLRMADVLGVPVPTMLDIAAEAPQFLSASPGAVRKQLAAAAAVLRRPPVLVVRALRAQPDLLFMTPRILANKVRVLQRILNRPHRLVVPVLLACPKLARVDMDAVRAAFGVLPVIAGRDAGFAFGMVCHAPHLLLEHPQVLVDQARHVRAAVAGVPAWQEQFRKLSPAQVADCLGHTAPVHARLVYLVHTQQADTITLHEVMTLRRGAFLARFPDAATHLNVRRHPRPLPPVPKWIPAPNEAPRRQAPSPEGVRAGQAGGRLLRGSTAMPSDLRREQLRGRQDEVVALQERTRMRGVPQQQPSTHLPQPGPAPVSRRLSEARSTGSHWQQGRPAAHGPSPIPSQGHGAAGGSLQELDQQGPYQQAAAEAEGHTPRVLQPPPSDQPAQQQPCQPSSLDEGAEIGPHGPPAVLQPEILWPTAVHEFRHGDTPGTWLTPARGARETVQGVVHANGNTATKGGGHDGWLADGRDRAVPANGAPGRVRRTPRSVHAQDHGQQGEVEARERDVHDVELVVLAARGCDSPVGEAANQAAQQGVLSHR